MRQQSPKLIISAERMRKKDTRNTFWLLVSGWDLCDGCKDAFAEALHGCFLCIMTYMAELISTRVTSGRQMMPNKQALIFLSFSSMVESLFWTTEIKIRLWKFTQFILPCVPSRHSVFVLASLCMLYMLERRRQAWRWKILLAVTLLANQGVRSRGCSFRCAHSGNWILLKLTVSL